MTTQLGRLPGDLPPIPDAGLGALLTDNGNLPLEEVDVHASITGLAAGIEVVQGFHNPFDVPLEATYIFPLPDRAAVTAMRMEAADRVIEGELKERGRARQDYDEAIARGRRAAIAEEDRPDVFTMRVGNIVPGERVTVRLSLSQPLPYEDGQATFRFPLVVAPRYIPGTPLDDTPAGRGVVPDTDAVPDASRIRPPVLLPGFPNPVRLSLTVDLDPAGLPLGEIRSSLHAVAEETGDRTTIRLHPGERLNRDFILRFALAERDQVTTSLVLVPDADAEGTFALTVLPPAGTGPARPRDVVLVLDRSGSMAGWKMVAARRAAARIVDTLTGGDRFAVMCFDNRVEWPPALPQALVTATDRHRFRAVEHLAGVSARGGTELLGPLEQAAALLADSARDRVLVLVTDGQVGNEDQILERLGRRLSGVAVHAVGIDRAVGAGFLARLTAIGQGRCELVESEDRLDEAMDHIHHRIGSPLVTGISLAADGLEIIPGTLAPARLPDLFAGVPLIVGGRWRGTPAGAVSVRGTAADGSTWEERATATVEDHPASTAIWARAHLRDLEDRYASGDRADLDRLEKRIVDTSLRFGVLCRFTAFVAVDSRAAVADGAPGHQVIQPVEPPSGWEMGGVAGPTFMAMETAGGFMPAPGAMPANTMPAPTAAASASDLGMPAAGAARPWQGRRRPATQAAPAPAGDRAELTPVRRQLTEELTQLRTAPEEERRRLLGDLGSRLRMLIPHLTGMGVDPEQLADLADLAEKLRVFEATGGPFTEMWEQTIRVLTEFTKAAAPSTRRSPPTVRRGFWKRQT